MLVFAASDKGGTGRSVTSANLLHQAALLGDDVCFLDFDFDFGAPTAGAIFGLNGVERGTGSGRGMHSYLHHGVTPGRLDVWRDAQRLCGRPPGSGRLVLLPGDEGGGEFTEPPSNEMIRRCVDLFLDLAAEFTVCIVDLSAGRSIATGLALAATGSPLMRSVETSWIVFHRWTRQHALAASGLAYGVHG